MIRLPRPSPVRKHAAALGAVLLVALGGCNNGDDEQPGTSTDLTITVTADEGAAPVVLRLECDPPGGDHPQPAEACKKIKAAGLKVFDPVPKDQACTMIFGGPQTATIDGSYKGADVTGTFNRSNGCEIDRWDKLGTTVFDVPLQ
ncbi:MAG: SSI family serine proteinase inhibitor [Aeromicrobium sp.]